MSKVAIVTDSAAYIPADLVNQYQMVSRPKPSTQAGEGLGILAQLPTKPSSADARSILARLKRTASTMTTQPRIY